MICTTIQNKDIDDIFDIIESGEVEMAEIRLDRCPLSQEDIEELFSSSDVPLIATCRVEEVRKSLAQNSNVQDERKLDAKAAQVAESKLIAAIHAGAAYADLEIEAPAMMSKRIRREARECGTFLVRSFHDFSGTDSLEALKALTEKCFSLGADVAKVVVSSSSEEDTDRVLSLYSHFKPSTLVAFAMGEHGKRSRVECLAKGAPYSYCALTEEEAAAPGQIPVEEMYEMVYGDRYFISVDEDYPLQMPASKSFSQRAIIAAALSDGLSTLSGYSPCGDSESAVAVAKALGAEVDIEDDVIRIKGIGASAGSLSMSSLHTGESGLLTRMMIPLVSILSSQNVHITGEKTLVNRPLRGAEEIMRAFGVRLKSSDEREEVHVPLDVIGTVAPGKVELSGAGGSQIVSGLLMALPLASSDTVIELKNPKSIPYLFITMDVMKAFGVRVWCDMEGGAEFAESKDWSDCTQMTFHIDGNQSYKATDMTIDGDWSSAANFLVAGAVFGKVCLSGLDTKSLQADLSIMDILMDAGASLSQMGADDSTEETDDSKGVITVQRAPLNAFEIDASNCPDLFPIISVLAAFCQGTSKIAGVGRLANKESDRGKAILEMLTSMGVKASITGDKLTIEGKSLAKRCLTNTLLKGGEYSSYHDHRMLMALKVAELGADSPITIDDTDCVSKSFPMFQELFDEIK